MPKYTADAESVTVEMTSDQVQPMKELSKKELGRMKSKQAVLAATAKKQQRPEDSVSNDVEVEAESHKRARMVL